MSSVPLSQSPEQHRWVVTMGNVSPRSPSGGLQHEQSLSAQTEWAGTRAPTTVVTISQINDFVSIFEHPSGPIDEPTSVRCCKASISSWRPTENVHFPWKCEISCQLTSICHPAEVPRSTVATKFATSSTPFTPMAVNCRLPLFQVTAI